MCLYIYVYTYMETLFTQLLTIIQIYFRITIFLRIFSRSFDNFSNRIYFRFAQWNCEVVFSIWSKCNSASSIKSIINFLSIFDLPSFKNLFFFLNFYQITFFYIHVKYNSIFARTVLCSSIKLYRGHGRIFYLFLLTREDIVLRSQFHCNVTSDIKIILRDYNF